MYARHETRQPIGIGVGVSARLIPCRPVCRLLSDGTSAAYYNTVAYRCVTASFLHIVAFDPPLSLLVSLMWLTRDGLNYTKNLIQWHCQLILPFWRLL